MNRLLPQTKLIRLIWLCGILWFIIIYYPGWHNPFFQDDFLLLELTHPQKIHSLIQFFQPISINFHYRPLAFNVYYYLLQIVFGMNWIAYHVLNALQLLGVSWLVFIILARLFKSRYWASLGAFIYLTAPIHYMTQFWTATFNNTQGAGFLLASFYMFLLSEEKKDRFKYAVSSIGLFILGILTNESVIVLPGIIIMYLLITAKLNVLQSVQRSLWWCLTAVGYMVIRYSTIGFPQDSDYGMEFSFTMLKTIRWYVLRAIGLPEGIAFVPYKPILYMGVFFLSLFLLRNILGYYRKFNFRRISFGISWFLLGGLIFFALPHHLSGYYLEIAFVGVVMIWLEILKQSKARVTGVALLAIWGIISLFSVRAMEATHWVSWRGAASFHHIRAIRALCPQMDNNQLVYEVAAEKDEVGIVLSQDKAAQVICQDFDLDFQIVQKQV